VEVPIELDGEVGVLGAGDFVCASTGLAVEVPIGLDDEAGILGAGDFVCASTGLVVEVPIELNEEAGASGAGDSISNSNMLSTGELGLEVGLLAIVLGPICVCMLWRSCKLVYVCCSEVVSWECVVVPS
jgi:hypothetical protein